MISISLGVAYKSMMSIWMKQTQMHKPCWIYTTPPATTSTPFRLSSSRSWCLRRILWVLTTSSRLRILLLGCLRSTGSRRVTSLVTISSQLSIRCLTHRCRKMTACLQNSSHLLKTHHTRGSTATLQDVAMQLSNNPHGNTNEHHLPPHANLL